MRKSALKVYVQDLDVKYHALCLQVREEVKGIAFRKISETCFVWVDGVSPASRVHGWTCKIEYMPLQSYAFLRTALVKTFENEKFGVPSSAFTLLSNGFFTHRGNQPDFPIKFSHRIVVSENDDFFTWNVESKWDKALTVLQNVQATWAFFNRVLQTSHSNLIRAKEVQLLTSLVYLMFRNCVSQCEEERDRKKTCFQCLRCWL